MMLALSPCGLYSVAWQLTSPSSEKAIDACPAPQGRSDQAANDCSTTRRTSAIGRFWVPSRCMLKPTHTPGQASGAPLVLQPSASRGQSPVQVVLRQNAAAVAALRRSAAAIVMEVRSFAPMLRAGL